MSSSSSADERSNPRMHIMIGVHISSCMLCLEKAAQSILSSCRVAMLLYITHLPLARLGYLHNANICIVSFVLTTLYHQPKLSRMEFKSMVDLLLAALVSASLARALHGPSSSVTPLPGWMLDPFRWLTGSYLNIILHYSLVLFLLSSDARKKRALWLGGTAKRQDEIFARLRYGIVALVFDYARSCAIWVSWNFAYLVNTYMSLVSMLISVSLAAFESGDDLESSRPSAWFMELGVLMMLGKVLPMLNFGLALAENQDPQEPDIVPEFTYRVVKPGNIRLLLIHPRSYSEPIRCSLVEVSIEQPPRFEATSYTWGSEEKPGVAIVDGKLLRITQNAYDLLQDLSSLCFPRLIWIDSISINQDDDIEKSEQIQLMTQIYQKASRVIVWLGNNPRAASDAQLSIITPDAWLVLDILTELSLDQKFNTDTKVSTYGKYSGQMTSERWQALRLFLCHPWFNRIWVVQEIALAREIRVLYCTAEIPWATLYSVIQFFWQNRLLISTLEGNSSSSIRDALAESLIGVDLMESLRLKRRVSESHRFAELLMLCRGYEATNPRDKIYGILGISSHVPNGLEIPDYRATPTKVYETCARKLLAGPEFQCALSSAFPGDLGIPSLPKIDAAPSWVADWGRCSTSSPLGGMPSPITYHAGGNQYSVASPVRVGDRSITLSGCFIDTVDHSGPIISTLKNGIDGTQTNTSDKIDLWNVCQDSIRDVIQLLSAHSPPSASDPYPHIKEQHLMEACWRTLIGDRTAGQRPAPATYSTYLSSWDQYCTGSLETSPEGATRASEALLFYYALIPTINGRKMCVTDGKFIGLVPAYAKKGDVVFVARGVQAPLLLRRIDAPPGSRVRKEGLWHYTLVGECYIHGIMDGVYGPDMDVEIF